MELDMLNNLQNMILTTIQQAIKINQQPKEWMSQISKPRNQINCAACFVAVHS